VDLTLKRFHGGTKSTLGVLFAGDQFHCFTCEDERRKIKIPGKTRIPSGRYQIKLRTAGGMHKRASVNSWHKGMLWLQDVPGFSWIYIHIGNTHQHTRGCILVGLNSCGGGEHGGWVERSGAAYRDLYLDVVKAMELGEDVWISVEDEECLFLAT